MIRPRVVAPGVEVFSARTPTLPPATHTNSYAVGGSEVLLVEPATPYDDERREWLSWARELASQGRRAVAIVPTHHHPDHVGGCAFFARELGLPVWAHALTRDRIEVPVERLLDDGEVLELGGPEGVRARVLHTPGHAPGHVCLQVEPGGAVVVGDMVASVGTILVAPGDGDMAEYLRQLERLAEVDATVALPAHGEPIAQPTAFFRRYIAHRLMREAKVLAAVASGGGEPAALVAVAYDDTPQVLWGIAELSLRAHLEKLVAEGRVVQAGERFEASAA